MNIFVRFSDLYQQNSASKGIEFRTQLREIDNKVSVSKC